MPDTHDDEPFDPHPFPEPPPEILAILEERKRHRPPPPPPAPPKDPATFDHAAAAKKYLTLLDDAIEWCLDNGRYDRNMSAVTGARLIKCSMDVAAALAAPAEREPRERAFTHRIVVEHIGTHHPPRKNFKTIRGVATAMEPQHLDAQDRERNEGALERAGADEAQG